MTNPDRTGFAPPPDDGLRGAVQVTDQDVNESVWAYAEVACGDLPVVAFRLPRTPITEDDEWWFRLPADEAIEVGALLTQIAGAAFATVELSNEPDPGPGDYPGAAAFAGTMLKAFDPGETELPLQVIYDRLAGPDGRHPAVHGGVAKMINANTKFGGIEFTLVGGEISVLRSTLEAVLDG